MNLMKGCMKPIFNKVDGYKRFYIDLPGMGSSKAPMKTANSDAILQIILCFIREFIAEDFILIGESFGGYLSVGIVLELKGKIEKLLLICPMVEPDVKKRKLPKKDFIKYDIDFLNTLPQQERDDFYLYAVTENKHTYDRYKKEVVFGLERANKEFIEELSRNYAYRRDVKKRLKKANYQTPTLLLAAKQDACVGYEDLYDFAKYLPRALYYLIDKAGHNLQIDQPDIFNELVINWLNNE